MKVPVRKNKVADELNIASHAGMNFGFPYYYGRATADPVNKTKYAARRFSATAFNFPQQVSSYGLTFYQGQMFPAKYKNAVFIAEQSSDSTTSKNGNKIVVAFHKGNRVTAVKSFAIGWANDGKVWGKPVDFIFHSGFRCELLSK